MPKTQPPGTVTVPSRDSADPVTFTAAVQPDVFDARDLDYRPRLQPLEPQVDVRRPEERYVMTQEGNSCTGHAVAAMVNAVLNAQRSREGDPALHVSPYMLYALARRYDEFEGDADEGSSLRGALKGWFYHGVLPEEAWPGLADEPDIDLDEQLAAKATELPLGAFYRVNAFRLDDMQSAVGELNGIVASAAIHEGWTTPAVVRRGSEVMHVIERRPDSRLLGGHAFAIVGYNEVGFLVQNSWGSGWGKGGFATLTYDDWLQSAYDAWVARPGVYSVVSMRERVKLVEDTAGGLASGPGPDLFRLQSHVVNLGNNGALSTSGRFRSSPAQVDRIFERMAEFHERWRDGALAEGSDKPARRVVLYAHGGLNSEATGLTIAQKHLNWWLNNHVYPVTFAWQSGAVESLMDHLTDTLQGRMPFGGLGIDLVEQFDRLVERIARSHLRWMWDEMKENAAVASLPASGAATPGATLTVARLADYAAEVAQAGETLEVHLAGHSAGSIFLTAMLPRLKDAGIVAESMTFLAPAIRSDRFVADALPALGGQVRRFVSFGLSDRRELDDVCGFKGKAVYQKSLLYLVSRGLERPSSGQGSEVPLLGMQRFADVEVGGGGSVRSRLADLADADLVWSPAGEPAGSRSDSRSHGGFDDDSQTMTSVIARMLRHDGEPTARMTYEPNTALLDPEGPAPDEPEAPASGIADSADAGTVPVTRAAAPQPGGVEVPETEQGERLPEEDVAPRTTSVVIDRLSRAGWRRDPRRNGPS